MTLEATINDRVYAVLARAMLDQALGQEVA